MQVQETTIEKISLQQNKIQSYTNLPFKTMVVN